MTKLTIFILSAIILVFSFSCNKEEEAVIKGTCTDGYQNNGEQGIDCGGPCEPCEQPIVPSFTMRVNEQFFRFDDYFIQIGSEGELYVSAADSMSLSLHFVMDETQNWALIPGSKMWASYRRYGSGNVPYSTQFTELVGDSHLIVTKHDEENRRISGLFYLKMLPASSDVDTLFVEAGQFIDLSY